MIYQNIINICLNKGFSAGDCHISRLSAEEHRNIFIQAGINLKATVLLRFAGLLLAGLLISFQLEAAGLVSGVVTPGQQAKMTFESNGVLIMRVPLGSLVQSGELLARMNSDEEQAALDKAEADLSLAKTELKKARYDVSNMSRLHKTRAISDNDLFDARIALSSAQARLKRAEASLRSAQVNLEQKNLRAPFSGVVTETKLQPGEYIEAGDETLTLSNIERLKLSVDIPLSLSENLASGTEAIIHDNGKDVGIVRVETILPVLDPASGLRRVVWVVTPINNREVLAGRYVQIRSWAAQIKDH